MASGSERAHPDEVAAFSATQASIDARSLEGFGVARDVAAGLPVAGLSAAPVMSNRGKTRPSVPRPFQALLEDAFRFGADLLPFPLPRLAPLSVGLDRPLCPMRPRRSFLRLALLTRQGRAGSHEQGDALRIAAPRVRVRVDGAGPRAEGGDHLGGLGLFADSEELEVVDAGFDVALGVAGRRKRLEQGSTSTYGGG
jgi:hypothetical protein